MYGCYPEEADSEFRFADRLSDHGPTIRSAPDVEDHVFVPTAIAEEVDVFQQCQ
jgi:hypothetical protein